MPTPKRFRLSAELPGSFLRAVPSELLIEGNVCGDIGEASEVFGSTSTPAEMIATIRL